MNVIAISREVYHVTPAVLVPAIIKNGVDPSFAVGQKKASWWVGDEKLLWAIAHVSARHKISVDGLLVCYVELPAAALAQTAWKNVYTCSMTIQVSRFVRPEDVLRKNHESEEGSETC